MDWIVERGVEKIPDGVSFDRASFVEPVNTCLKGMKQLNPQTGDVCVILGQGPIGLIFTMMAVRAGLQVVTTDTVARRRNLAVHFGAKYALDPRDRGFEDAVRSLTSGRGADVVIVAASAKGIVGQAIACSRPGARVLLFAQTSDQERIDISGADICVGERTLLGSYSSSVDVQRESADLVFSGELPLEELITHRYPLGEIHEGIARALHPDEVSLKIVLSPQQ
jgi:L-iditol 2-dehydrogenase